MIFLNIAAATDRSTKLQQETHLQPLVDTLGVELVAARQNPERLPDLEITHAHDARRLVVLGTVARISARRNKMHFELENQAQVGSGHRDYCIHQESPC